MAKVFFQYEETPFVFDIKHSKLCQIKNERLIEINEPNILVTFKSVGLKKNLEKNHGLLHSLYGHI
jgi:hypothetical protein